MKGAKHLRMVDEKVHQTQRVRRDSCRYGVCFVEMYYLCTADFVRLAHVMALN